MQSKRSNRVLRKLFDKLSSLAEGEIVSWAIHHPFDFFFADLKCMGGDFKVGHSFMIKVFKDRRDIASKTLIKKLIRDLMLIYLF